MTNAKKTSQPIISQYKISRDKCPKTDKETEEMNKVPYSNVVGSIMYLMVSTRPEIAYAISVLSKYMSNLGKLNWLAMKWIFRYLIGTTDIGLVFKQSQNPTLVEGFCDSDYAGDRDTRRSTSAYYFLVWENCISWKVQLQPVVALSTTKAVYVSATEAIKEAVWIKGVLKELKLLKSIPIIYSNNQSSIHLCKNHVFHDKTKHVEIKYHFIRDKVTQGEVTVEKVPTEHNPADMGTKVVTLSKFKHCMNLLGINKGD
ncbi:secreted RxLR effector protein 161-like [Humulus lupulus]|uniref:secreted RxLR effector protein 161-like n=1 Tax=Humulus lupulus TaxID=3486 RepID=UPI002B40666F|nr:secreted RxLR effector protein 161-like [Humulus lupulus]